MHASEPGHKRRARLSFHSRARTAFAVLFILAAAAGCREAPRAFGPSVGTARVHADEFLFSLAARFSDVQRNAKYDNARHNLARSALTPSRAFDDTSLWTAVPAPTTRTLLVGGHLYDGHYRLDALPAVPRPASLGDTRHTVTLTRIDPKTYSWDTIVEFGAGTITANDVGSIFTALFETAEGRGDRQLRDEYRATFPRTAAVLGALFSIDTLHPVPLADGSTFVTVTLTAHPDQLKAVLPAFSQYLSKYLMPAKARITLSDASGATWFEVNAAKGQQTLRFRTLHGHLLPFTGAARAMPDTLRMHMDLALHIKVFTVGFRDLDMDFVITHVEHERAWTMVARKEPQWDLPLASEHVIRASLQKPFEGTGAIFRIGVEDDGGQTLITRFSHLTVQESNVLKFVGGLSAHAASELAGRSEREEDAFLRESFDALRADVRALLGG